MRLGVRAALVDGAVVTGDVVVAHGEVVGVGAAPIGDTRGQGLAVPGFVDLQVNGFGGIDFLAADDAGYAVASAALARFGVTAFQPTLVSSPLPVFQQALGWAAKAQTMGQSTPGPRILGVHLEGPFLAPKCKGAHDERHLLAPDGDALARLCEWGPVTFLTLAPELPGALAMVSWLVERGVVVSLGHTDAAAAQANAGFNAGARAVTHLFNAQRRFTSRDPGITGVGLTRAGVVVGVIADFVHLAPETVHATWLATRGRLMLVTDAIAAAAVPGGAGDYALGDRVVHVDDTAARLDDGTLAGSILTMDKAVRNLASLGVPLLDAVAAATTVPAALIGRPELGTLRPGTPADIAVLDDDCEVARTVVAGTEVWRA